MRKSKVHTCVIASLIATAVSALPQDLASIRQTLQAKYALTTTTADKSDIVTPGCVLVLKKSNLVTVDVTGRNVYPNRYQNGVLKQRFFGLGIPIPGGTGLTGAVRTFVSGEKLWVTAIDIKDSGIVFTLFSDAISDVRYGGTLTFPFAKGSVPSVNEAAAKVAEVFDIQPSDWAKTAPPNKSEPTPIRPASPAELRPEPILPPAPPPADPKTIASGQTTDQVTAILGQPNGIATVGAKQIYSYKELKVTFVNGKVTDVE